MSDKIVRPAILMLACVLLTGILLMTIGFYQQNVLLIKTGIPLTLFASLMIFVQTILPLQKKVQKTSILRKRL